MCNPFRSPISAGSIEKCIELYVFNKTYEHYSHEGEMPDLDINKLYEIAESSHKNVNRNLKSKVGLSPEIVNIVYYTAVD